MRKPFIIAAALLCLMAARAGAAPRSQWYEIALVNATGGTNTASDIEGYIEEVRAWATDGAATGQVVVAIVPLDSTVGAVNVATNQVIDEKTWRPSVDRTSVDGAALTSDPPGRFIVAGEKVRFIVTASGTNRTWRFRVKTSDQ